MAASDTLSNGRALKWAFLISIGLTMAIVGLVGAFRRALFYPDDLESFVGPAGAKHRAFIDARGSFDGISLVACASDWPYTFEEPFALGSINFYEAYDSANLFWSRDGSMLAFRVIPRGTKEQTFEAAYDFCTHTPMRYCDERIRTLIQIRGGLGPEVKVMTDRKGRYE